MLMKTVAVVDGGDRSEEMATWGETFNSGGDLQQRRRL